LEEFSVFSDQEVEYFRRSTEELYTQTDKALVLNVGGVSLGDIARVPGMGLKRPRGIRDVSRTGTSA
jgi:hypothetical protein